MSDFFLVKEKTFLLALKISDRSHYRILFPRRFMWPSIPDIAQCRVSQFHIGARRDKSLSARLFPSNQQKKVDVFLMLIFNVCPRIGQAMIGRFSPQQALIVIIHED